MKLFSLFIVILILGSAVQAACIKDARVELRAKPSAQSKITWVVGRFMPLMVGERKGAWYSVTDVDSKQHWIHARHLTSQFDCLIVRSSSANLRQGPGEKFPNTGLSYVKKYGVFKKIDRDEDWLKVQDEFGFVHWVHENTVWEPRVRKNITF